MTPDKHFAAVLGQLGRWQSGLHVNNKVGTRTVKTGDDPIKVFKKAVEVVEDESRFDALAADPPAIAPVTNAATRSLDRFREAWEARDWDRFHVRRIGLAVNRRMRRDLDGDAARLRATAERRVGRALRQGSKRRGWALDRHGGGAPQNATSASTRSPTTRCQ